METQLIGLTAGQSADAASGGSFAGSSGGGLLPVNENINGYVIQRLLATAGEAEVYLCSRDGTPYALKYYYAKQPKNEIVEKVKSFNHSGIVKLFEYGEYQGHFYSVLEYAEGGSLDDKTPEGKYKYLPLSEDDALQIVGETINAFDACHKAGIIHRDIKPGNLFFKNAVFTDGVYKGSTVLVGDFGIASSFEADMGMSKRMTETRARTEGYAAPEVYSGVIGPEMDYYSLGVTLWVLLTAEEPFVNEKGHALYPGQIMLDTMQGKTAENLLARSPQISARMKNLLRGLLTVRHDKRWNYAEVTRFLAGENVEVFDEVRTLPLVEIGGEKCSSYREIAEALIKHPEEGKTFVFRGKLPAYLIKVDQKLADRLLDLIDQYSEQKKETEGLFHIAWSLCPNMAFPIDHGQKIESLQDMLSILETDPSALLPFLRDESKGFYAYLEATGLGDHGKQVREIAGSVRGNIRAVSRIVVAFQGNSIAPFQDGVNNELKLSSIEQLETLPDYLKERVPILIQRNYGPLPAWIENMTAKDLDLWLARLEERKALIEKEGMWKYFTLFLEGKDLAFFIDYLIKEGDAESILGAGSSLKEDGEFLALNKLVEGVWKRFWAGKDWKTVRSIFELVDKDHLDGLSFGYDFCFANIGAAYARENNPDKAGRYISSAWKLNPVGIDADGDPYTLFLGMALLQSKDYAGAIDFFDKSLAVEPDKVMALFYKGSCLFNLKKYKDAVACCSVLLDSSSMKDLSVKVIAQVYRIRGMSNQALGIKDKAVKDLAEAKRREAEAKRLEAKAKPTPGAGKKFCGECGAKLAPGEKFCGECGAAV